MNNSIQNMERFDAYLSHEMSNPERLIFEQELDSNPAFKAAFEAHCQFISAVHDGAEYGEIRDLLHMIHQKSGITKRTFFLTPKFLVPLALVASIALIVTIINPFAKDGNEMAENGDYRQLNHQVAPSATETTDTEVSVMDSTTALLEYEYLIDDNVFIASPEFLTELKSSPAGTAFMISRDGYFLTSKHLVDKSPLITLQQKDDAVTFEAAVVYTDSLMDFAILKCHKTIADTFEPVPFRFSKKEIQLGQDVFTLGYPKNEVVYTKGVISSEKGYKSDTLSFEVSLPSNPGYSGAPLFTYDGDLIGIVIANNTRQQAVTYVLRHHYIENVLTNLSKNEDMKIDMKTNYSKRYAQHSNLIKSYRSYIFEVHIQTVHPE